MSPMQAVAVILLGAAGLILLANLIKAVVHKEFTFAHQMRDIPEPQ